MCVFNGTYTIVPTALTWRQKLIFIALSERSNFTTKEVTVSTKDIAFDLKEMKISQDMVKREINKMIKSGYIEKISVRKKDKLPTYRLASFAPVKKEVTPVDTQAVAPVTDTAKASDTNGLQNLKNNSAPVDAPVKTQDNKNFAPVKASDTNGLQNTLHRKEEFCTGKCTGKCTGESGTMTGIADFYAPVVAPVVAPHIQYNNNNNNNILKEKEIYKEKEKVIEGNNFSSLFALAIKSGIIINNPVQIEKWQQIEKDFEETEIKDCLKYVQEKNIRSINYLDKMLIGRKADKKKEKFKVDYTVMDKKAVRKYGKQLDALGHRSTDIYLQYTDKFTGKLLHEEFYKTVWDY